MAKSIIKINPVTMEISIEVSDSFLEKYFEKLTDRFPKSPKQTPKITSIKTKAKPAAKAKPVKKGKVKKTKAVPVVKVRKGSIQEAILGKIKMGNENGVSVGDIVEATGLKKVQIFTVTNRLKKVGIIKASGRGKYLYVEKPEVKE